jgi:hypothetical protein
MSRDFKTEAAVTPSVNELPAWRPTQRNAAEDKGTRIKPQCLSAGLALLADKLDRVELLQATLVNSYRR